MAKQINANGERVLLSIGEQPSTEGVLIWSSLREIGPKKPDIRAENSPTASRASDPKPLRFGFKDTQCMGTKRWRKKGGETNMFNVQLSLCVSP